MTYQSVNQPEDRTMSDSITPEPVYLGGVAVGDADGLRTALTVWVDGLDGLDNRAVGLHQLQAIKGAVGEAEGELVDRLAEDMPGAWVETPVGILKTDHRGGYSSWDADAIYPSILKAVQARPCDPATGERLSFEDGAAAMLDALRDVISSPSFKVTGLRRYGIDVDDVRATSARRKIVRFV